MHNSHTIFCGYKDAGYHSKQSLEDNSFKDRHIGHMYFQISEDRVKDFDKLTVAFNFTIGVGIYRAMTRSSELVMP